MSGYINEKLNIYLICFSTVPSSYKIRYIPLLLGCVIVFPNRLKYFYFLLAFDLFL
ncbi:MAG: hypothetical protein CM15mP23_18740 [Cryomorphaceae bacterium]|nr:MAG: hypothetical protein CM15mP23_18740 [Cryomorphaceae bacterium]